MKQDTDAGNDDSADPDKENVCKAMLETVKKNIRGACAHLERSFDQKLDERLGDLKLLLNMSARPIDFTESDKGLDSIYVEFEKTEPN